MLGDIAAGPGPSTLKRLRGDPERRPHVFEVEGSRYRADLYVPPAGARAGILLVPGAAEEGKDDPRLVAFASTLARARFLVLAVDLPGLRELEVRPGQVPQLGDAFAHLRALAPRYRGGPAGMAAFSYAVGPAVLAALEPRTAPHVDFLLAVGGYHDLTAALTYFTTGAYRVDDTERRREPHPYGKWVFAVSSTGRLTDPGDRGRFRRMVERKKQDPAAPLDDLAEGLGPEGRALYRLVVNREPRRVPELLRALPAPIREDLRALDLADKDLGPLRAHLILVHGRDDPIIPYTESVALHRRLPEGQAELHLLRGLAHVDVEPGAGDTLRMWRAVAALLRARDGV
ncbi:MAG: alpha/beta hydrolase [Deferrisomatales bacterium]